jgi:hypothetical protein
MERLTNVYYERAVKRDASALAALREICGWHAGSAGQRLIDAGFAAQRLIDVSYRCAVEGDEAAALHLRATAESKGEYAQQRFTDLQFALAKEGDADALDWLRTAADNGDLYAADLLARALEAVSDPSTRLQLLRAEFHAGNSRHATAAC